MFGEPTAEAGGGIVGAIANLCFVLAVACRPRLDFVLGSLCALECRIGELTAEAGGGIVAALAKRFILACRPRLVFVLGTSCRLECRSNSLPREYCFL
jgi:hypothetical protein